MPVKTRSRTREEERKTAEMAAKQLLKLSLMHPDYMSPPVTPVYTHISPPPAPRKKARKMFFGDSYLLRDCLFDIRKSTDKFIRLLDELETQYA